MLALLIPYKFNNWKSKLSGFLSIQILIQFLSAICGILIVRNLSKQEYAYFTLANSVQGAMSVIASTGTMSALLSIGGKVWRDSDRLGQLLSSTMRLRIWQGLLSALVMTPILIFLLTKNGAPTYYSIILATGILVEFWLYLRNTLWTVILQLNTKLGQIQLNDFFGAGVRLLQLFLLKKFLNASVGIFVSVVATGLQYFFLKYHVRKVVPLNSPVLTSDVEEIKKYVAHQMPNSIYFCIQGQLTVFLISFFGDPQAIAEVGALSRLALIFALLNSVMIKIIAPSFARCQTKHKLVSIYYQCLLAYIVFSGLLIGTVAAFPSQSLSVLGNAYSGLQEEVILMVVGQSLMAFSSAVKQLNSARGWISLLWAIPPGVVITQVLLLFILDISTVLGVIAFSALTTIPVLCVHLLMSYRGFRALESST